MSLSRKFCGRDEFLLFIDQFDCQFVHEAELRASSLDEAVSECEDTTIGIIRMDLSNWRGEDVSEDVAARWLSLYEPDITAQSTLPDFVRHSEAWHEYLEDHTDIKPQVGQRLDDFDLGIGRYAR